MLLNTIIEAYFAIPTAAISASWEAVVPLRKINNRITQCLKVFFMAALLIKGVISNNVLCLFAPESMTISSTPSDFIFSVNAESSSRLFAVTPRIAFSAFAIFAIASAFLNWRQI